MPVRAVTSFNVCPLKQYGYSALLAISMENCMYRSSRTKTRMNADEHGWSEQ